MATKGSRKEQEHDHDNARRRRRATTRIARRNVWAALLHFGCLALAGVVDSIQIKHRQKLPLLHPARRPTSNLAFESSCTTPRLGRARVAMNAAGHDQSQNEGKHGNPLDDPPIIDSISPPDSSVAVADSADAVWDPVQQIYVGGVVPEHESVRELHDGLRVFGYGSLCWNPGQDGDAVLSHPAVATSLGRVAKYRRCWAQRSTDHRGTPEFPGIVCTLLTCDEVQPLLRPRRRKRRPNRFPSNVDTLGRVYHVPRDLVEPCLNELDFREKGGYARDVIDVRLEDDCASERKQEDSSSPSTLSDQVVRALLYRGTVDNPAMWLRPLQDLTFAAAIMSVAVGPSGENLEYLERLDSFLTQRRLEGATDCDSGDSLVADCDNDDDESDDTTALAQLARRLRDNYHLFFLFGAGSNQHNQLMLRTTSPSVEGTPSADEGGRENYDNDEEVHGLKELVAACVPQRQGEIPPSPACGAGPDVAVDVLAGGGHTGILTGSGRLFLVGWNESGQLGRSPADDITDDESDSESPCDGNDIPMPLILKELPNVRVETASLGFSHTLIVEKDTGRLFGFGCNEKGQVHGWLDGLGGRNEETPSAVHAPSTPSWAASTNERFVSVAAGVFHSAAVTSHGELCLWGCPRSIGYDRSSSSMQNGVQRWRPCDGSRVVKVACGRKHTVAVDDRNRIWTIGDNRHGQLGRTAENANHGVPQIVALDSSAESSSYSVESISCGWSHTVILAKGIGAGNGAGSTRVYGWGRNDRGQLGTGATADVRVPWRLFESHHVQSIECGSEFTAVVCTNGKVWSCGWNEHGNLATGDCRDRFELAPAVGVSFGGFSATPQIGRPPSYPETSSIRVAAGGSHLVVMRVATQPALSALH